MKLGHKLAYLSGQRRPVFLAAGFFDGVHRGHQAIIRKIIGAARRAQGTAWVMTFDTHPLKVLHPTIAPKLLTSTPHKLRLLKAMGVQGCIVIPFTRELARRQPKAFVAMLALAAPALRQIVIGRNWTFGRQGCGTPATLKALAPVYGFKVAVIPPVRWHGTVVSSTRIRAAVLAGRLTEAAGMLGRPFSLLGTVVPGRGIGRTLGIPTANLNPHNEVAPPNGVYIVRASWDGATYPGIVNLGIRPTLIQRPPGAGGAFHRPERVLELHLLDMHRNLYGKDIEVAFLKKLRRERAFPSLEALQGQIRKDIEQTRKFFAAVSRLKGKMLGKR